MKKIIKILGIVIISFIALYNVTLIAFCGYHCYKCKVRSSGDIRYGTNSAARELSEKGKEKEIIIMSNIVDGHLMVLGFKAPISSGTSFTFDSINLKKLYFNSDILNNVDKNGIELSGGNIDTNIYFPFFNNIDNNGVDEFFRLSSPSKIYFSCEYVTRNSNVFNYYECTIANVSYNYNYEKTGYKTFYIDDVDGEKLVNLPPNPIREGYKFEGWYKEKECLNKWDFENDKIPEKQYDIDNNYQYQETILYAKWSK